MGRKIAVAAVALVPLFLFWSAARGDWDLEHPQADGKYEHTKTDDMDAYGTGDYGWSAFLKIHLIDDQDTPWGMNKTVLVTVSDTWDLTDPWPPFFDHDMNPGTPLVFPPGEQGTVELYKRDLMGSTSHIESHDFTVED